MTTEINLGVVDMATKAPQIKYIKNVSDLKEKCLFNPYNQRDLSKQVIELVTDETGESYFRLKPAVSVTPEYRESFNALLDSLISVETEVLNTVEGEKTNYKVSFVVNNPARVTPYDNGMATKGHIFLAANTRYNILLQIIDIVGESNVDFTFPYFIDPNFDPQNALAQLLTAGLVDNTGLPLKGDAKTNAETLERAYNSLDMESDDEKFEWMRENLIYRSNGVKKAPRLIPASFMTKWSTVKKYPKVADAIENYISFEHQANFINQIFLKYLPLTSGEDECLTILIQLLQDFVTNVLTKAAKVSTFNNYDAFKKYVDNYFNPPPLTAVGEVEETDESEDTEAVSDDEPKTGQDLLSYVSSVNESYYVVTEYDFNLLPEGDQEKVYKIMSTINRQLKKLMALTSPKPEKMSKKVKNAGVDVSEESNDDTDTVVELSEDTIDESDSEDTEALEVISQ